MIFDTHNSDFRRYFSLVKGSKRGRKFEKNNFFFLFGDKSPMFCICEKNASLFLMPLSNKRPLSDLEICTNAFVIVTFLLQVAPRGDNL